MSVMGIAARRWRRAVKNAGSSAPSNFVHRFEAGTVGAAVSTNVNSPGDRPWDAVGVGTGATLTYDNAHVSHGSVSAKLTPGTSVNATVRWTTPESNLRGAFRYYVWWDTNPTAETYPLWLGPSSTVKSFNLSLMSTGSLRVLGVSGASLYASPAGTLPTGGWARIEVLFNIDPDNAAASQYRLAVYAGDSTTAINDSGWRSGDIGTAGISLVRLGKYSTDANTAVHWFDSVAYKGAATEFIGPESTDTTPPQNVAFNPGALPIGQASYAIPSGAIFVAKNGNDTTGDGSISAPYLTARKGISSAADGGTVVIRAGEYHEGGPQYTTGFTSGLGNQISVPQNNVTVQNYPGEAVWFDGSLVTTGWTADTTSVPGRTVWRVPFVQTVDRSPTEVKGESASAQYGNFILPEFPIAHWPESVFYNGTQLKQVQNLSEVGPGKFYVVGAANGTGTHVNTFTSSEYIIGDNPAGNEVRISRLARLLGLSRSGFTLRGIGIRRYNSSQCDWGTIFCSASTAHQPVWENLIVEDMSSRALQSGGNQSTVRRCTFRRNGQIAIGNGSDNHIIEHNIFEENNYKRFNYGPDAGAMKTGRCQQGVIRYNWFNKTYGHACWLDEVAYQTKIHGNLFTNNYGNGVMAEISEGNLIVDNIFVNNGILSTDVASRPPYACPAIRVSGSNNCALWANTFYNCEASIFINQDPRAPYASGSFGWDPRFNQAWYQANCTWDITKITLGNNATLGSTGMNAVQATLIAIGAPAGKTPIWQGVGLMKGNLYSRFSSTQPTRFANSYGDSTGVKIHSSMTNSGTGTYDPPISWQQAFGEQGSVLKTVAAPLANTSTYQIATNTLSGVTPAAVPPEVQALLDVSPFNAQPVGAGYLSSPMP